MQALFLLALGIQENAVETEHSEFVRKATACGVFEVVGRLLQDTENVLTPPHIRKLASWVLTNGGQTDTAMETDERSEENDKRKAEAAAARRAKILAQMNKAQKNFAAENKAALASLKETREDTTGADSSEDLQTETVCVGPGMTSRQECTQLYTCILCQEESSVDGKAVMVLAAFIQKSTVLGSAGAESGQSEVSPHHLQVSRGRSGVWWWSSHVSHYIFLPRLRSSRLQLRPCHALHLLSKVLPKSRVERKRKN